MISVTVKTLDSQNYEHTAPDDITVKEFKEKISGAVKITADKQRLIYCGRVLSDEKKLCEYDVNGKVIHLVERAPPQTSNASSSSSRGSENSTARNGSRAGGTGNEGNSFVLGAFTLPSEALDQNYLSQIVQNVVSGIGPLGRNASIMSRTSEDGSSVDVHINLGQVQVQSEPQMRLSHVKTLLSQAERILTRLENNESGSNQDASMQNAPSASAPQAQTNDISPETMENSNTVEEDNSAPASAQQNELNVNPGDPTATGTPRRRNVLHPPSTLLAEVLDQIHSVRERLQPFFNEYRNCIRDDPDLNDNPAESAAKTLFGNRVRQVLHFVSHAEHAIADVFLNYNQPPPRVCRTFLPNNLHVPSGSADADGSANGNNGGPRGHSFQTSTTANDVAAANGTVIQASLPVQVQINRLAVNNNTPASSNSSAPTTSTTNTRPVESRPTEAHPTESNLDSSSRNIGGGLFSLDSLGSTIFPAMSSAAVGLLGGSNDGNQSSFQIPIQNLLSGASNTANGHQQPIPRNILDVLQIVTAGGVPTPDGLTPQSAAPSQGAAPTSQSTASSTQSTASSQGAAPSSQSETSTNSPSTDASATVTNDQQNTVGAAAVAAAVASAMAASNSVGNATNANNNNNNLAGLEGASSFDPFLPCFSRWAGTENSTPPRQSPNITSSTGLHIRTHVPFMGQMRQQQAQRQGQEQPLQQAARPLTVENIMDNFMSYMITAPFMNGVDMLWDSEDEGRSGSYIASVEHHATRILNQMNAVQDQRGRNLNDQENSTNSERRALVPSQFIEVMQEILRQISRSRRREGNSGNPRIAAFLRTLQGVANPTPAEILRSRALRNEQSLMEHNSFRDFVHDICELVAEKWSFYDLICVFCGIVRPLTEIHAELKTLINVHFSRHLEDASHPIISLKAIANYFFRVETIARKRGIIILPDITFVRTLRTFCNSRLRNLIEVVRLPEGIDGFGQMLLSQLRRGITSFQIICDFCLEVTGYCIQDVIEALFMELSSSLPENSFEKTFIFTIVQKAATELRFCRLLPINPDARRNIIERYSLLKSSLPTVPPVFFVNGESSDDESEPMEEDQTSLRSLHTPSQSTSSSSAGLILNNFQEALSDYILFNQEDTNKIMPLLQHEVTTYIEPFLRRRSNPSQSKQTNVSTSPSTSSAESQSLDSQFRNDGYIQNPGPSFVIHKLLNAAGLPLDIPLQVIEFDALLKNLIQTGEGRLTDLLYKLSSCFLVDVARMAFMLPMTYEMMEYKEIEEYKGSVDRSVEVLRQFINQHIVTIDPSCRQLSKEQRQIIFKKVDHFIDHEYSQVFKFIQNEIGFRGNLDYQETLRLFLKKAFVNLILAINSYESNDATKNSMSRLENMVANYFWHFVLITVLCVNGGISSIAEICHKFLKMKSTSAEAERRLVARTVVFLFYSFIRRRAGVMISTSDKSYKETYYKDIDFEVAKGKTGSGQDVNMDGDKFGESKEDRNRKMKEKPAAINEDADQSWTRVVPPEWVPIIKEDVIKQRNEARPQGPFSETYISAMPSKRRKIMKDDKGRQISTASSLPNALRQAISASGVQANDEAMQRVGQEAASNTSLQNSYEQQFKKDVVNKLERHPNYTASNFPKSDRYFKF